MAVRQFTMRIASVIYAQVQARAEVLGRSVNKEMESLLAWAIENQVEADLATMKLMRDHIEGKRKDVSETAALLGLADRPV